MQDFDLKWGQILTTIVRGMPTRAQRLRRLVAFLLLVQLVFSTLMSVLVIAEGGTYCFIATCQIKLDFLRLGLAGMLLPSGGVNESTHAATPAGLV